MTSLQSRSAPDGAELPGAPRRSRRGLATREAILDAAERLIAERGLLGVSMGEIARRADLRSRNAAQYYFPTIDELVMAVLVRFAPEPRRRREELMRAFDRAADPDDLRALVEIAVRPMAEQLGRSGAQFRFIAQLISPNLDDRFHWIDEPDLATLKEWDARVCAALPHVDAEVRRLRIDMALDVFASTLAGLEGRLERGDSCDLDRATGALTDAMTAILSGPAPPKR